MSVADQRDVSAETSRIEDGLAILAGLVADMLAGTDRAGTGDTPGDSQNEVEGSPSSENHRIPASEQCSDIKMEAGTYECLRKYVAVTRQTCEHQPGR